MLFYLWPWSNDGETHAAQILLGICVSLSLLGILFYLIGKLFHAVGLCIVAVSLWILAGVLGGISAILFILVGIYG